ncbi:MAG: hypothetical protein O6852_00410 [Gammaproteobacteria bacterium]|nr:hypothetical protein [Gammaproteobacteria bacterium]
MRFDNPLERRDTKERRDSIHGAAFPIITRKGVCVRNDRRIQPDRRISNIVVDEGLVEEATFDLLLSQYSKKN